MKYIQIKRNFKLLTFLLIIHSKKNIIFSKIYSNFFNLFINKDFSSFAHQITYNSVSPHQKAKDIYDPDESKTL